MTRTGVTLSWNLLLAARPAKNLSALLIIWSGALIGSLSNWHVPAVASFALLVMLSWTTHLNVLADVELDKNRKPQFFRWLNFRPDLLRPVLWAEAMIAGGLMLLPLAMGHALATLGLLLSTACAVLYSHNSFAVDPQRSRLKGKLWGHPAAFLVGYLGAWIAGLGCGDDRQVCLWIPLAIGASFADYGLYLAESAADSEEERSAGLNSPAAILGAEGCKWLGGALAVIAALIVTVVYAYDSRILVAFLPAIGVRLIAVLMISDSDGVVRPWLSDLAFHGARTMTLVTLAMT